MNAQIPKVCDKDGGDGFQDGSCTLEECKGWCADAVSLGALDSACKFYTHETAKGECRISSTCNGIQEREGRITQVVSTPAAT